MNTRLRPRWRKVLADLWGNKVRSLLVIGSVAVGLFAVGLIATIHAVLSTDMGAGYAAVNPANILVNTDSIDDETVEFVRSVEGVQEAEALRVFDLMARTGPDEWSRITLRAYPDFDDFNISHLKYESGKYPPEDREMVLDVAKAGDLYMPNGVVELKLPSGKIRTLKPVGIIHDQTIGDASTGGGYFMAPIQGYISTDILEWLEQPEDYNRINVTVSEDFDNEDHLREVANRVGDAVEDSGGLVYNAMVRGRHDHPNGSYIDAMTGVLFSLGALVVFLSAFLITNTLSALLNQQAQQIAVMKTVGARSTQVIGIYMALILAFGLLALILSLPLAHQASFAWLESLTRLVNTRVIAVRIIPLAVILQVLIALLVPQLAGIAPVLRGSRVKVQDVLSGSLSEVDPTHRGWIERRIHGVSGKGISRPLLISLRNTFRNRSRLALTLITLILGGAIFIGTFTARASIDSFILKVGSYFQADVNVTLGEAYRISQVEHALRNVEGVAAVEGWAYGSAELLTEDDKASDAVQVLGPPANSPLIQAILIKGRWVEAGDEGAIALSERFLSRYPDLDVGDTLRMRVNGEEMEWTVVGFFQLAGKSSGFVAYTTYEYLSEQIRQQNRAVTYRITADREMTLEEQRALSIRVESALQAQGFTVTDVNSGKTLVQNTSAPLDVLTTFLLVMALLTAMVGSMGLMGTMSMNVLDRTREIGVLRAIGASDRAVMNMVLVEGLLIGLISWVLAVAASVPIGKLLSDTIHLAVFDAPSEFIFTAAGPLWWLLAVVVLSVLASVLPARNAARLTIREALAYE